MKEGANNGDRLAEIPDAELNALLDKLAAYASKLIRSLCWRGIGSIGVLPNGESAETVVQVAVEKLLDGAKWDQGKNVEKVLFGILRGHIANLVRSWENRHFINLSDDEGKEGSIPTSTLDIVGWDGFSPVKFLERSEDDDEALGILETFEDGSPEYRIVSAIFNGANKRAIILEEAQLSAKEYDAARKRLRTFFEKRWRNRAPDQHKKVEVKS